MSELFEIEDFSKEEIKTTALNNPILDKISNTADKLNLNQGFSVNLTSFIGNRKEASLYASIRHRLGILETAYKSNNLIVKYTVKKIANADNITTGFKIIRII